jgi:hypothetical protein
VASFTERLTDEIADLAARLGVDVDRAFAVWYGMVALRLEEQEAVDAASYDGGNDRGIDVFLVDDELERVIIAQTKNVKSANKAPKPGDLSLLMDAPDELADAQELRDAGRPDLAEAAESLKDAQERGYTAELQLVYPGAQRPDLDRKVRQFNRQHASEGIVATIIRLPDLESLYQEHLGTWSPVADATFQLMPGTYHREKGEYGDSIIASIPGRSLKALYSQHGMRLFDQNVRLYLGHRKGTVNAGIRETLADSAERPNFWAYNNGLTMVVEDFELDPDKHELKVSKLSIVNGCQTTVSIGTANDEEADQVTVLARVVAARRAIVDNIIRFTNSQTPINVWDLSARDKIQRRLKQELDELDEPWFYALRRGELQGAPKKRYGPHGKRRVLPFPLSAQYLASFRQLPVEAYKDKARLFTAYRDEVFPPDIQAADLLWAWHVGRAVEEAISSLRTETKPDATTELILKRGGRFFATAIVALLLERRNGADFVARVDASRLKDRAMFQRLVKYARFALGIYMDAMKDLLEAGADLSTLIRSTDTAKRISDKTETAVYRVGSAEKYLNEILPRLPGIKAP